MHTKFERTASFLTDATGVAVTIDVGDNPSQAEPQIDKQTKK